MKKRKMLRTALVLAAALLALAVFPAAAEAPETGEGRFEAARNGRLALYVSEDLCRIDVEDAATGQVWSSSLNDPTAEGLKIIPAQQKRVNSLMILNCTNLKTGLGVVNNIALKTEKDLQASFELIENGVRLSYTLGTYQVGASVEFTLDGDCLVARIPYDSIREEGEFSMTGIDLLPFLFSATDRAEGFFLYPDGCGAVMEFRDNAHYRETAQLYPVYGDYQHHEKLLDMFAQESPCVMMPVFGMNRGGYGLLAVVEEGAETVRISLNPSNNIIGINYMYASCQYRRSFEDQRVTDRAISVFDKEIIPADYRVRIRFMEEENPDYSAMACAWRKDLLESGVTRKTGGPTVAVDLFTHASEKGLLFDVPRVVTTVKQAEEILKTLDAAGVKNIRASLKGWTAGGYGKTPDHWPVSGSIGGEADVRSLLDTAHGLGITVSLTANFLEASSDQQGFSHRNDVVYTGNHIILTDPEGKIFLLSTDVGKDRYERFLKAVGGLALDGVRLERIGVAPGYNYSGRRYIYASDSVKMYLEMAREAREAGLVPESEGGNAYLLGSVDFFTGIPYEDFGLQATTRAVPFYQIAVHGLTDYTGKPGNLSSDLKREVLRWVEMGYTPCFELTWDNTEALMYTNYQWLFSARCADWTERVAEAAAQFTEGPLAELSDRFIEKHEFLSDTLRKVTWENGTVVYVNYAETEAEADGRKIGPESWLAVEKKE